MKKLISLVLALIMLFFLISCSSSLQVEEGKTSTGETAEAVTKTEEKGEETRGELTIPQGFSVGYDKAVVNPDNGTLLGGYVAANPDRKSTYVQDDIMLTCTAISDGENIFLFFNLDATGATQSVSDQLGEFAQKGYGIPAENVILNATHTHNGPALNNPPGHGILQYKKKLYVAAKQVMDAALYDLAPAEIYIASAHTEGLNYVRRYVTLDGKTFLGNWPSTLDPAKARHETEVDSEMQVIRFVREKGKEVVLCNWQCHPCSDGLAGQNRTEVSSDFVGPWREKVEKEADVYFAFFQGAAGNVVSGGRLKGEVSNSPYNAYGRKIADVTLGALENMTRVSAGELKAVRKVVTYTSKDGSGQDSFSMSAYAIGDLALVTVPCEWHDVLGMQVKDESPFTMTFISGYTNGSEGYIPASFAWDNGGYEVDKTHYERGTGEKMVEELKGLLNQIYSENQAENQN